MVALTQLEEQIQQGNIAAEMLVFDNTITKNGALSTQWLMRAKDTWLIRYFHKP